MTEPGDVSRRQDLEPRVRDEARRTPRGLD
jgi:hypothetical protein